MSIPIGAGAGADLRLNFEQQRELAQVDYEGPAVKLHGVKLGFRPPHVPVYLGALGPQMLRLAGAHADGAALNWCTPEQITWSRSEIEAGARKAGRDPAEVKVIEWI